MSNKHQALRKFRSTELFYGKFNDLNGQHPWMQIMPEGFVSYRVRELEQGKVVYFNYILAKEMGLISSDHPPHLNNELEARLLKTFSLQIINEYDELTKRRINPKTIKPFPYMATRYLQLQHANKKGKTSGDGRGIWNGIIQHRGQIWDVSSRGTGVTCLAPGFVEANKPLKTGGTEFGYGCGQAEIDELLGAAILAEAMHLQGIQTERVLCVIDLGKGVGIGVRAAPNLIRPAHLFLYLKQERLKELKAATDYFLDRQIQNRAWNIKHKGPAKYDEMLEILCDKFADFTAKLDIDYIFAWLDWDGDNVLAEAGIIDYGSVRQFGIRHDRYRYDDVERFSTNLNEQRTKARQIIQVFCQLVDYIKTGKKKGIKEFAHHPALVKFNQKFSRHRADRLLYRMGFEMTQRELILNKHRHVFDQFDAVYRYFECAKVSGHMQRVPDGVNHPALFNLRPILKDLPRFFLNSKKTLNDSFMPEEEFFSKMLSGFAKSKDAKMGKKQRLYIRKFQELYKQMIFISSGKFKPERCLKDLARHSEKLNSEKRITGNALIEIVDEVIQAQKKGLGPSQVQNIIDRLVLEHNGMPEIPLSRFYQEMQNQLPMVRSDLYSKLLDIVAENKETI